MKPSLYKTLLRHSPAKLLMLLAGVWVIVIISGLMEESARAPFPPETEHPTLDPSDFSATEFIPPDATEPLETIPQSPFTSRFFESLMIEQSYQRHADDYLMMPFDSLNAYDPDLDQPETTDEPPPPPATEHLIYRGYVHHPDGTRIAFIENTQTGRTQRYRKGDPINGLSVESIDRLQVELLTAQGEPVDIPRRLTAPDPQPETAGSAAAPAASATNAATLTADPPES